MQTLLDDGIEHLNDELLLVTTGSIATYPVKQVLAMIPLHGQFGLSLR